MSQKAYFLVEGCDYTPDKYIIPGQIIASLKTPHIACGKPLETPDKIDPTYQDNWEMERTRTISGSIGIWAKFLAVIFGIGGEIAAEAEKSDSSIWKFDRLETRFFMPDQAYIEASMNVPEVKRYFEQHHDESAFMITGVKIARNAALTQAKKRALGAKGSLALNSSTGPQTFWNCGQVDNQTFTSSTDFVFAYRLIKIYKHPKTGKLTSKEPEKGQVLELEDSLQDGASVPVEDVATEQDSKVQMQDFEIAGFDKEDIGLHSTPPAFEKDTVTGDLRIDGEEKFKVLWLK